MVPVFTLQKYRQAKILCRKSNDLKTIYENATYRYIGMSIQSGRAGSCKTSPATPFLPQLSHSADSPLRDGPPWQAHTLTAAK